MEDTKNEKYGFIYITTNNINGMKYIGQKKYGVPNWKTYLGSGTYLKRAINKYGRENFSREIIDEAYSREDLNEKEKYWIEYYNATNNDKFYNIASGGDGGNVAKGYSEEEYLEYQRNRLDRVRDTILKGEDSPMHKLLESDVIEIIDRLKNNETLIKIANDYNVSQTTIGDIKMHKTWKSFTNGIKFPDGKENMKRINIRGKPVGMYDMQNNLIKEFRNARDAERQTGIGYKLISRVCNGERSHTHGYIFKFI